MEEVVGSSINVCGRDDVVAGASDVEDSERGRGLSRCEQQCCGSAFERGDALLGDVLRRVHDSGVDVAKLCECEEVLGVVGTVERVRRGAEDGHGARVRRGVRCSTGVNLLCFKLPVHGVSLG